LDATRVLRLIGSQHSGSGLIVEALTSAGEVWEFATLAYEMMPLTRAEVVDLRIQRAARDAERPRRSQRRAMAAQGFNAGTRWEARLSDLQALVNRVRCFGELPEGQRDYWMFLATNAMSWLAPPDRLEREAHALARDVCHWMTDREARSRLHAVFKRALMALRKWGAQAFSATLDHDPENEPNLVQLRPCPSRAEDVWRRRKLRPLPVHREAALRCTVSAQSVHRRSRLLRGWGAAVPV
jgi:hypothetical protein